MKQEWFVIPCEHPAIAGHFPGRPIVPGVLLLSYALSKLSLYTPYHLKKVKFLKMVLPDDKVLVELVTQKPGSYQLQLKVAEQIVLSAKIVEGNSDTVALSVPSTKGQLIDAATIAKRIPHSGSMCLLQKALYWDDNSMLVEAVSHQEQSNPLAEYKDNKTILSALVLPEYVSQAIALHGATLASIQKSAADVAISTPRAGYLAIIPKCHFYCADLQSIKAPLRIYVSILLRQTNACFYQFGVWADKQLLAAGEVGIVLEQT